MTETDWRALCKELVEEVDGLYEPLQDMGYGWISLGSEALISRARTALAELESEKDVKPPPRPPIQNPPEHLHLVRYGVTWEGSPDKPLLTPMADGYWTPWHVAADLLKRQGNLAPAGEVEYLVRYLRDWGDNYGDATEFHRSADLLERQAAPVPVPASEHPDERNPECVKAWPECWEGGYDPRCCRFPKSCSCEVSHALPSEGVAVPLKEMPNFVAGYKAGLNDGRLECQARAKDYSITDLEPVAWMYRGEPDFDGSKWRGNWLVTLDRKLAEQGTKPDKPIPLFRAGAALDEVTVAPSPDWLQRRLERSGVRPINNVVDITNLVMLETGDSAGPDPAGIGLRQGRSGWQPMATAPRDGTEILASDYDAIEIVSWGERQGWEGWSNREGQIMFPAQWQPLPDHPPLPH